MASVPESAHEPAVPLIPEPDVSDVPDVPEIPALPPVSIWARLALGGCLVALVIFVLLMIPVAVVFFVAALPAHLRFGRGVRWLPIVGPLYYLAFVPVAAYFLEVHWWWVVLFTVGALWPCFPPNPIAFFFHPRLRRAAFRAVEYVEQEEGLPTDPLRIGIEATEPGRTVVWVGMVGEQFPHAPTRRFIVSDDGAVEPLEWDTDPEPGDGQSAPTDDRPFA
jgi:hypothetical protein